MFSYFWSSEKPIEDYTQITEDEKKSLATKLVDRVGEYFSSVQTKGLLVTGTAAISLLGLNKIRGIGATPTITNGNGISTITGTDTAGAITTTSTSGVTVTFSSAFTSPPRVVFSAKNSITAINIRSFHVSSTTTGFTINMEPLTTPLGVGDNLQFNYIVVQ
jgi:hypothetical protein